MRISVALDGPKQRDLAFFAGDNESIEVVVYEHDGDEEPIPVYNARIVTAWGGGYTIPVGEPFIVPDQYSGVVPYRMIAELTEVISTDTLLTAMVDGVETILLSAVDGSLLVSTLATDGTAIPSTVTLAYGTLRVRGDWMGRSGTDYGWRC
jgi:hypothetical protein